MVPFSLVGFAGLPFDIGECVVKCCGKTAEAFAAGSLRADRSLLLASCFGHEALDFVFSHRHCTDAKADAALCTINLDDTRLDILTDLECIAHLLDAAVGNLRDVDETIDAIFELDKRAEGSDLRNLALDDGTDRELLGDIVPRILLSLLEAERDALLLRIDVENDRLDFLTLLEALGRMVDLARPAHIADVDHTVDTLFELDERTVSREVADLARNLRTGREALLHRIPRIVLGLADAEGDLLVFDVDRENDHLDFIAHGEHVGSARDALGPAELGNVDEAFDSGSDLDERAVGGEIDHLARNARSDGELIKNVAPGILLGLLETERDALAVAIDIENHDFELLSDLEHFARVLDAAPAHVGDVEKSVDAVEIDERAEVGDILHAAGADLVLLEARQELRLLLGESALDEFAARNDEIAALVGNLDDLEIVGLTDVGLKLLDGSDFNLAAGQERFDVVDLDEQTAADGALDRTVDDTSLDVTLEDLFPADLVVGALLGDFDHAGLVVFKLDQHDGDLVADLDAGFAEFAEGHGTFRLVTDVDENVVTLDCAYGSFDDGTVLEFGFLTGGGEYFRHRGRPLRRSHRLTNCHFVSLLWFTCVHGFLPCPPRF